MSIHARIPKNLITVIALLSLLLTGCSLTLKESSFIAQDKQLQVITNEEMANWQHHFSEQTLSHVSINSTEQDGSQVTLNGLYLDNKNSTDLLFFIQGNGMRLKEGGIEVLKRLSALNLDIIVFDHRGLGTSQGHATIEKLSLDAERQLAFIEQTIKPSQIILHGFSLGSFIAARLPKNSKISALVLQGSATNVDDWIDAKVPWYSKPFLNINMDEAFKTVDNQRIVENDYDGPLLIIAGENDQQVPATLAKKLYQASQSTHKQLMTVKGADHNNMLNQPEQLIIYQGFIESLGKQNAASKGLSHQ